MTELRSEREIRRPEATISFDRELELLRKIETLAFQCAELSAALAEALQNLEYVQRAHPEVTGISRRVAAIKLIRQLGVTAAT